MQVTVESFGTYQNQSYDEIMITTDNGVQISFSNLGARINRWGIEVAEGEYEQIILGHQNAAEVFESGSYYGATIGRVAGRIEKGLFYIGQESYQLEVNNGTNHLHGGKEGLDLAKFDYEIVQEEDEVHIRFMYRDKHGHNGYPGNMDISVTHTYTRQNEWRIKYEATTDQTTLFNPTNHVYFNLNGNNSRDILNHYLQIDSKMYLPLESDMIAYEGGKTVENTVFDFRIPVKLSERLCANEPQFDYTKGLDHPFILESENGVKARISLPCKQRVIEMETQEEAVVVYTHGYLPNINTIWGNPLRQFAGITLETQQVPNAINRTYKGDSILTPDHPYQSCTVYRLIE